MAATAVGCRQKYGCLRFSWRGALNPLQCLLYGMFRGLFGMPILHPRKPGAPKPPLSVGITGHCKWKCEFGNRAVVVMKY